VARVRNPSIRFASSCCLAIALTGNIARAQSMPAPPDRSDGWNTATNVLAASSLAIELVNADETQVIATDRASRKSWLEHRGYRFISLDQALVDPAYATADLYIGPEGFSWLVRWKLAFGQQADWQNEPDAPEWVTKMSGDIRRAKLKR